MSDLGTSLVRTVVPVVVGWLIAVALAAGIEVSPETANALTLGLSSVFTVAYYAIVRVLERRWPALGWLLGSPNTPAYKTPVAQG